MVRERGSAPWHARLLSETIHVRLRQEKVNIVAPAHHGDGHHANRWGNKQRGKQSTNGPCYVCVRGGGGLTCNQRERTGACFTCALHSALRGRTTRTRRHQRRCALAFVLTPPRPLPLHPPHPAVGTGTLPLASPRCSAAVGPQPACTRTWMAGERSEDGGAPTHPHHATPPCESTMRNHHASTSRSA